MSNVKIIICGKACCGKDYIKNQFINQGFSPDVSYTSREMRDIEKPGREYNFISKEKFEALISERFFYQHQRFNGNYYGTSKVNFAVNNLFIMNVEGISKILPEDRPNCLVIFLDIPLDVRVERMKNRGWKSEIIDERIEADEKEYRYFHDYDIKITNPLFQL